ncbi:MAG: oxygenase MpaB family protein [Gemmatimonadetes bacterium]|nr:oxygenase MpaB family protein [Gemmatimonadota bacterium]
MRVPVAYQPGYEKARASNLELADKYIEYTLIGDPEADSLVNAIAAADQEQQAEFIRAGMDEDEEALRAAPQAVGEFFDGIGTPPEWFDPEVVYAGCRKFHAYSDLFLTAFVTDIIVRGFTTLISQSFFITGRLTDRGVRRLRQNIRHLLEIMLPGGLERHGEGWKLSVRIRLVHARVRQQLLASEDWDQEAHGMPLSAAHIALASCNFSGMMLWAAGRIGARLNDEERDSFMQIWRYTAWLMGVPDALLFRDEAEAREIFRVGYMCEPPFGVEAIAMANSVINSAPLVIGIEDKDERRDLLSYGYRLSRALLGDELADQLMFPKSRTTGALVYLRLRGRIQEVIDALRGPGQRAKGLRTQNFMTMLDISVLDEEGISYRLPDELHGDASRW